ncbi:11213_t:CDS:2, partial [Ambispora leptoticha]
EAQDDENANDEISDDDIPTAGTRQQWQYAHRQFHQRIVARCQSQEQNRKMQVRSKNTRPDNIKQVTELDDTNQIEYLPSVSTIGLLDKVRAAIYLLMDELWAVPTDLALVATYLDPRFKHFNWATNNEKERAQNLVKTLYDKLKIKLTIPDDIEESFVDKDYEDNDDFFNELETNSIQTNSEEEDE